MGESEREREEKEKEEKQEDTQGTQANDARNDSQSDQIRNALKVEIEKDFEEFAYSDPERCRLDESFAAAMQLMDKHSATLKRATVEILKKHESFLHKYFSVYCQGNNASRMGFIRSDALLEYSDLV